MGAQQHRHVAVTSWREDAVQILRKRAEELGLYVTPIFRAKVNGYCTFFTVPCGSKVGWEEYEAEALALSRFTTALKSIPGTTWAMTSVGELGVSVETSEDDEIEENKRRAR